MIVADTNVITYLGIDSPYTALAEQLLLKDCDWIVPRLWRSEFRNVLALYLCKALLTLDQALQIQSEMEDFLGGREYEVSSFDVLRLANNSACSAYDCEFVALAKSFEIKMVTLDRKLARSFPETVNLLGH
jgi:predicted nucleic acid-binding protein